MLDLQRTSRAYVKKENNNRRLRKKNKTCGKECMLSFIVRKGTELWNRIRTTYCKNSNSKIAQHFSVTDGSIMPHLAQKVRHVFSVCDGHYLTKRILDDDSFHLVFIWNRTRAAFGREVDSHLILDDFSQLSQKDVDIVIEVAHPSVTREHGEQILKHCHYLVGSPSILADPEVERKLTLAASNHAVFIPSGAFWGGEDIRKMADAGTLKSLQVTIKKHPRSLKLQGEIALRNEEVLELPVILYRGPVRKLCLMAPQNTNFMAAAAVAAHNLGFDNVEGCLISDPSLEKWHIVEIEAKGHPKDDGSCFTCHTTRKNPSTLGAVTGSATYEAFFQSLKSRTVMESIKWKSGGFHLC